MNPKVQLIPGDVIVDYATQFLFPSHNISTVCYMPSTVYLKRIISGGVCQGKRFLFASGCFHLSICLSEDVVRLLPIPPQAEGEAISADIYKWRFICFYGDVPVCQPKTNMTEKTIIF